MNDVLQTIHQSLLELVGYTVRVLPAIGLAIVVLVVTRFSVKPIRRLVRASTDHLVKSISLQLLFLQMTTVGVWVAGGLVACLLVFPGLRLGDVIGLLGLGSVAIGFAFQDIFKNFLAGILLLLNEPFKVHDQIIVNDFEGTVEAINLRSTAIRTYQNELVVIPNAIVFTSPVQVLTNYSTRRTDLMIGLDYNTPLSRARGLLLNALQDIDGVLSSPKPEVDLVGFGDSSINFMVRYWTLPEIVHVRHAKTNVVISLKQACDDADLNIPYPIRTVYFFDQQHHSDHYPASASTASK